MSKTQANSTTTVIYGASSADLDVKWFAVYTRPRHEKRVVKHFTVRQVESFLPLYSSRRRWRDASKVDLQMPLFPSYLFVFISSQRRVPVLQVPAVLAIVGSSRESAPISEEVIVRLRRELPLRSLEPHPYLVVGERARIRMGPLAGMEGVLLRKCCRVVLTLKQIMQSVSVEVDAADLEPVSLHHGYDS